MEFLIVALVVFIFIVLLYAVLEASSQKGRSTALWVILSFLVTPLLVLVCLAAMGETETKRREKLLSDKLYLDENNKD
ncbi:hypothetical protein [Dysgonomonas massiliensis]|uniref:hypothetical protein n=1 Tax=Dysgonomonas massiliensis TaxID=2040292 RepID=UPI0011AF0124|nr:hypothetical protein [Dysgonomonas massiliensis]